MSKKKILVTIGILIVIVISCFLLNKPNNDNSNAYYGNGKMTEITTKEVNSKYQNNDSFLLYVYNNYCTFKISCEEIFLDSLKENKIDAYKITYEDFKNTKIHEKVRYAPSFIIIKNGKIINYLDANKKDDYMKYQDSNIFTEWLLKNIK